MLWEVIEVAWTPNQLSTPTSRPSRVICNDCDRGSIPAGNCARSSGVSRSKDPRERWTPASCSAPLVTPTLEGARSWWAIRAASTIPATLASNVTGRKPSIDRSTIGWPDVPPGATWVCVAVMTTLPSW